MTLSTEPNSICHRLSPAARLAIAFAVALIALLTPVEYWPLHGVLFTLTFIGHTLARVPIGMLGKRLGLFLPFVLLIAAGVPLSQGLAGGWELMATIVIRALVTFFAMLWLVQVLPFEELLRTLARWRVPGVLLASLSFSYRYLFVLWDELDRMRTARASRSFGGMGRVSRWTLSTRLLGMLLIRSLSRAERVHAAMLARGWQGGVTAGRDPRSADGGPPRAFNQPREFAPNPTAAPPAPAPPPESRPDSASTASSPPPRQTAHPSSSE